MAKLESYVRCAQLPAPSTSSCREDSPGSQQTSPNPGSKTRDWIARVVQMAFEYRDAQHFANLSYKIEFSPRRGAPCCSRGFYGDEHAARRGMQNRRANRSIQPARQCSLV